ncbi:MAG: lysylphosphatidylglycerol synthase transmembrane domain-containing protein [Candidatus Omnitrophota bacterium]
MKDKFKNILSFLVRFGLSAGLIFLLLRKINFLQVFELIKHSSSHYLALAALMFILCHILLFVRWDLILKGLDVHIPLGRLLAAFFVGLFFNLFLPSSAGGDLARSIDLFSHTPHKAKVVASVILDRLSGFVSMVLIAGAGLIFGSRFVFDSSVFITLGLFLFLLGGIILILFSPKVFAKLSRIFPRLAHKLMSLNEAFVIFRGRYAVIVASIFLSVAAQTLFFLVSFFIVRALGQEVRIVYFLILMPLITLVASLPVSIGGLGVRDASCVFFFGKIGITSSMALGLSLLNFAFLSGIGLIGGLIYVLHQWLEPKPKTS